MKFGDSLFFIGVIYVIYYGIVLLYDALTSRTVQITTGIENYTVQRPEDSALHVSSSNHENYMPKPPVPQEAVTETTCTATETVTTGIDDNTFKLSDLTTDDNEDGNGGSAVSQKIQLTDDASTVIGKPAVAENGIMGGFPVSGQPLEIAKLVELTDEFILAAMGEDSDYRAALRNSVSY